MSEMWYVYLLKLSEYPYFYTGEASDLRKRMIEHKHNQNKATKHKNPSLVFFQSCTTKNYALVREKQIKKMSKEAKFMLMAEFEDVISLFK